MIPVSQVLLTKFNTIWMRVSINLRREVNVSLAVLAATKMRECLNIGFMPTHMIVV